MQRITVDAHLSRELPPRLLDKAGLHVLRWKHTPDVIGTLQWKPVRNRWRLTRWRKIGPTGHNHFTERELACELHAWTMDPTAGPELEAWTDTPEWNRGILQCQFTQCWNACAAAGRYDLGQQLDAYALDHGLETAITEMLPQIYKEIRQ